MTLNSKMVQNDLIISSVFEVYRTRRANADNKAYEIREALSHDNAYTENHYKIKSLSLDIAKADYEQNAQLKDKLMREREILREKEKEILKEKGLSENDLKPHYTCEKCSDTAYTKDGKLCNCFFKTLASVATKILDITPPALPSFDNYLCNDELSEKYKNLFMTYVDKFPPEKIKNLILTGTTGTGKTFAAGCIANALMSRNNTVIYLSATKLVNVFLRYHTAPLGDKQAISDLLTNSDLLVIDDLGTEPIFKNVTIEYITSFLSERINDKKPFIITTNLNMDEIKSRYSERLFSRLCGDESTIIDFSGKDLRLKK